MKKFRQHILENKDKREYDYEGEMVVGQLKRMAIASQRLQDMLEPDTNLPEWVQLKITLALDYIETAASYMEGEMKDMDECWTGYRQAGMKKKGDKMVPNCVPVKEEIKEAVNYHMENKIPFTENIFRPGSESFFSLMQEAKELYLEGVYTPFDEFEKDLLESDIGEFAEYEGELVALDFPFELDEDSDPTKGKGVGKPFRKSGGGAVYVRSGGKVKLVNFSQSGMTKKFNDPGALKSFMARHHCLTNNDKTSASYWACRWPRYFSNSGKQWW